MWSALWDCGRRDDRQAQVMQKMECDKDMEIPIIDEYKKIMSEAEGREVVPGRGCYG